MTRAEWAYIAGLFDGEGCVWGYQTTSSLSYSVQLRISQHDPEAIRFLYDRLEGRYYERDMTLDRYKGHYRKKIRYIWESGTREQTRRVLLGMYPYVLVKRKQVQVALLMIKILGPARVHRRTPEEYARLGKLTHRLKELKR
jgi:hypothetical protein